MSSARTTHFRRATPLFVVEPAAPAGACRHYKRHALSLRARGGTEEEDGRRKRADTGLRPRARARRHGQFWGPAAPLPRPPAQCEEVRALQPRSLPRPCSHCSHAQRTPTSYTSCRHLLAAWARDSSIYQLVADQPPCAAQPFGLNLHGEMRMRTVDERRRVKCRPASWRAAPLRLTRARSGPHDSHRNLMGQQQRKAALTRTTARNLHRVSPQHRRHTADFPKPRVIKLGMCVNCRPHNLRVVAHHGGKRR